MKSCVEVVSGVKFINQLKKLCLRYGYLICFQMIIMVIRVFEVFLLELGSFTILLYININKEMIVICQYHWPKGLSSLLAFSKT